MLDTNLPDLLNDLRQLVQNARSRAAANINSKLVMLYWHVGARLTLELATPRAAYGEQIMRISAHYRIWRWFQSIFCLAPATASAKS